jgi:hypothetical protein
MLTLLLACTTPWSLGGNDIDDDPEINNAADTGGAQHDDVAGLAIAWHGLACEDAHAAFDVSADGSGVHVVHSGVDAACDAVWELVPSADTATIDIAYAVSGDASCTCGWTLDYTIVGVAPGTWTITTGEESASVDVP